jgi:lysophospholipase L1-like esterase
VAFILLTAVALDALFGAGAGMAGVAGGPSSPAAVSPVVTAAMVAAGPTGATVLRSPSEAAAAAPAVSWTALPRGARQAGVPSCRAVSTVRATRAPAGRIPVVAAGAGSTATSPGTDPSAGAAARTRPVAAFLGDSYTSGYNGAGYGRAGWPAIVSASLGLRPLNRAVPGTGFVNPGWTDQPIRSRVGALLRADPRIVFLAGGHNDRRFSTAATRAAAIAVIDRLHRALPDARLVVIGPIWSGDVAPASLLRLRDALRRKAAAVGALFVDPIRGRWLAGAAKRFIGPDGLHPTNAGHRHIAALVLRALRAAERPGTTGQPSRTAPDRVAPAPAVTEVRDTPIGPCAT